MGYHYVLENSEQIKEDTIEFKEILLWKINEFLMDSIPTKRPIRITIEKETRELKQIRLVNELLQKPSKLI